MIGVKVFSRDKNGQVAIIFGVMLLAIVTVIGAVIDYSRANRDRTQLQNAIDAAVLAGAISPAATRDTVAANTLRASLAGSDIKNVAATWTLSGSNYTGAASGSMQTSFMALVGKTSVAIGASATATIKSASASKVCMLALAPATTQALLVNSGVSLNAPNCRIDVKSTAAPAAIFNASSTLNVSKICVQGTSVIQNAGPVGVLETGCRAAVDPFIGALPAVTPGACTVSNQNYAGVNVLSPGVYCGAFNFNGVGSLTLNPGLYVFKDAVWNLNSGWSVSGSGVTLYFANQNSGIQINSGVNLSISAPTSGTYSDILIYEPGGLPNSSIVFNGGAGHQYKGLIYLPSRNATFNGVSSITAESITLVFNTIILDNLNWHFGTSARAIEPADGGGSTAVLSK